MFKNYAKVAVRNLSKRKTYTFINILGLAIGIACCLLISVYVIYEVNYDRFIEDADRIYRITQTSISPTKEEAGATTPFKAGPSLQTEYPQLIESSLRFFDMQEPSRTLLNKSNNRSFREENFFFVDSTFFDVLSVELLRGSPVDALDNPLSLVMTEAAAKRYFGDEDPIGKVLSFKGVRNLTVTGIMEEWPEQSHMSIDMVASMNSLDELYRGQDYDESWFWNPCWTYIKLKPDASRSELEDQLQAFADKYYMPDRPEGETVELALQPITDIHLYSNLDQEMEPNNSILYIYIFSGVALLILIIACVNFMNLATARSSERAREVGMRKVLGADRRELFKQFIGESFLMSLLSVLLAVILVYLMMPYFNDFVGKQLSLRMIPTSYAVLAIIGLTVAVGLLAGVYPSLYLSAFRPTAILKGEMVQGSKGVAFRKGLIVSQFALSVILMIGTAVIYMQLNHMQNKKLGFDKEQIIILPIKQNLIAWEFPTFKQRALEHAGVMSVTGTEKVLGSDQQTYYKYMPASSGQGEGSSTMALYVAHDFTETYGIELLAGRSFSRDFATDKDRAILINRSMLNRLEADTPGEALGEVFYFYPSDGERQEFSVIGVVEDFHYTSTKKEIAPLVIRLVDETVPIVRHIEYAALRIAPGSMNSVLKHIQTVWEEVNPIDPFEYSFQDEELNKIYASEIRMREVITLFSFLAILVACLGLFGLASFTASKRTKEIGIRKTLGASVQAIIYLLSKEYVKLVLLANVIAWPVVYLMVNLWLQDFPYRIALGWNLVAVFALSAVASVVICLLTVSYQSLKAAMLNPVESIQRE